MATFEDVLRRLKVTHFIKTRDIVVDNNLSQPVQAFTATGAAEKASGLITITHSSVAAAITVPAPTGPGQRLTVLNTSATGTAAHTAVCPSGVTWNGSDDTATLAAPGRSFEAISISETQWVVVNNNSVTFS